MSNKFPKDFIWGVASSAYQIEGTGQYDMGESIYDVFCREACRVIDSSSGERACDHYNRYKEDIKLMQSLGIRNYRFSLSWPRVIPDGTGQISEKGLDFYDRLVDCMLEHSITPYMEFFHWEYP